MPNPNHDGITNCDYDILVSPHLSSVLRTFTWGEKYTMQRNLSTIVIVIGAAIETASAALH